MMQVPRTRNALSFGLILVLAGGASCFNPEGSSEGEQESGTVADPTVASTTVTNTTGPSATQTEGSSTAGPSEGTSSSTTDHETQGVTTTGSDPVESGSSSGLSSSSQDAGASGSEGCVGSCSSESSTSSGGVPMSTGGDDLRPLGSECTSRSECTSGHCVDGVCCESSCSDVCMQCGADGLCDDVPSDDPGCGVIDCPASGECRTYQADMTTNRCAAFGQCRTTGDCEFTNTPARTTCGGEETSEICDGAGNCEFASVWCGGDEECSVDPGRCCKDANDVISCQSSGETCTLGATRAESYECNDQSDCALGLICCRQSPSTSGPALTSTVCMPSIECVSAPGIARTQACSTSTECLSGTCRLQHQVPYPYGTCGT